jgi:hypothetical protein
VQKIRTQVVVDVVVTGAVVVVVGGAVVVVVWAGPAVVPVVGVPALGVATGRSTSVELGVAVAAVVWCVTFGLGALTGAVVGVTGGGGVVTVVVVAGGGAAAAKAATP